MNSLEENLMNNYVFQNRFKSYFVEDLSEIINCLSAVSDVSKSSSVPYNISGKFGNKTRIISFPNIFTYAYGVNKISNLPIVDFGKMNSNFNKMEIDFKNRKFKSNSFSAFLEERINTLLSEYDRMYKIDIQSFYKSIYTHVFDKMGNPSLSKIDDYIRIINNKKTNGLILGNLLSTYAANEVIEYLTQEILSIIPSCKINYFSDQFYIFYNSYDYDDEFILDTVKKIIEKDYFEFKINKNDSKVYTHEEVNKEMDFKRLVVNLFSIQKSKKGNIDNSMGNLIHFFNLFIQYYYVVDSNKRLSFVEVVLRSIFSSSSNLYRLVRLSSNNEYDLKFKKIINILMLFLRDYPSLILLYIDIGLWEIVIEANFLDANNRKAFFNIFYRLLDNNYTFLEGVYYFHICYLLKEDADREKFSIELYKRRFGDNQIIDSIIVETFNIKESRASVINASFNGSDWLINYTKLTQIRYHLLINISSSCLMKTIDMCKRNKIKIIKSLKDITINPNKKSKYESVVESFKTKTYKGNDIDEKDYFEYN